MPPPIESADRNEKALLWEFDSVDSYGEVRVSDYVELDVRWVLKKRNMLNANGDLVAVDAQMVSDRAIPEQSVLWRGGEDDLPGTASVPEGDLWQVVASSTAFDLKGIYARYEIGLVRFKDSLPTVV